MFQGRTAVSMPASFKEQLMELIPNRTASVDALIEGDSREVGSLIRAQLPQLDELVLVTMLDGAGGPARVRAVLVRRMELRDLLRQWEAVHPHLAD